MRHFIFIGHFYSGSPLQSNNLDKGLFFLKNPLILGTYKLHLRYGEI